MPPTVKALVLQLYLSGNIQGDTHYKASYLHQTNQALHSSPLKGKVNNLRQDLLYDYNAAMC